ncbi:MAG: SRPBCC family protein [Cucumibacter sp.]
MSKPGRLTIDASGEREIVVTRVFDAPRELVFDALTRPDLLRRWFTGPDGWTLSVCEFEPRVGGAYRNVWRQESDGFEMGMGGIIREFVRPERVVATEKYDQAWYAGEAVTKQELSERGGKTVLTMTLRYESREVRDLVLKSPMEGGLSVGFDRLEDFLATLH